MRCPSFYILHSFVFCCAEPQVFFISLKKLQMYICCFDKVFHDGMCCFIIHSHICVYKRECWCIFEGLCLKSSVQTLNILRGNVFQNNLSIPLLNHPVSWACQENYKFHVVQMELSERVCTFDNLSLPRKLQVLFCSDGVVRKGVHLITSVYASLCVSHEFDAFVTICTLGCVELKLVKELRFMAFNCFSGCYTEL